MNKKSITTNKTLRELVGKIDRKALSSVVSKLKKSETTIYWTREELNEAAKQAEEYFGSREKLVEAICKESGIPADTKRTIPVHKDNLRVLVKWGFLPKRTRRHNENEAYLDWLSKHT